MTRGFTESTILSLEPLTFRIFYYLLNFASTPPFPLPPFPLALSAQKRNGASFLCIESLFFSLFFIQTTFLGASLSAGTS